VATKQNEKRNFSLHIIINHLKKSSIMKKLVLLSAVVFAMTFASCKTDPATSASSSSTSTPAITENVQSTPAEATSAVASENKEAAEVSENKDAAAPAAEQATEEKKGLLGTAKEAAEKHPKLVKGGKILATAALTVGAFLLGKKVGSKMPEVIDVVAEEVEDAVENATE
jgi:hypothetical protein